MSRTAALLSAFLTLALAGRAHARQQRPPVSPHDLKRLSSEGVAQNEADAFEWFRKAGDKGHAKAQYMTGLAYFMGRGVERVTLTGLA